MTPPVAVVTGSNKGIGFGIVKALCEKLQGGTVYLTSRDEQRGKEAIAKLNELGLKAEYHQLDVLDKASIIALKNFIKEKHGGLDILVNNAGIAFKVASPEPFSVQAKETVATNYFALLDVCHELFSLLRPHARVVNVSSSCGHSTKIPPGDKRDKFLDPNLTEEQLSDLMRSFVKAAEEGKHESLGWPNSAYNVSKVGVSKLTFIQQAAFDKNGPEDVVVNAVHPGYVDTDMTSHRGPLTIEQGAAAPAHAALLPPNVKEPRGAYIWYDKKIVDWVKDLPSPF